MAHRRDSIRHSVHPRAVWKVVAESYPCEDCGAAPGHPCLTANNNIAHTPHVWRTNLASQNLWRPAGAYPDPTPPYPDYPTNPHVNAPWEAP